MGRELRMVPANWEHPKKSDGRYQPMYDRSYREAAAEWKAGYEEWKTNPRSDCEYWEWCGNPPIPEYYRPEWKDEERTHFQMYEDTSEGTPISPVFAAKDELCRWLVANRASAFADFTATYEEWMALCNRGWAPSMVITGNQIQSGVEYMAEREDEKES